jgi:hypothetical protein
MPKIKSLTKNELDILAELLEMAADNPQDNPFAEIIIPATEANKTMMAAIYADYLDGSDLEGALEALDIEKDELIECPWMLMDYFAARCRTLSNT